jgi:hypothetical protein
MKSEITVAPPNSIIFVMDFKSGKLPKSFDGGLIATSPSSVVIGTYPEPDGKTTIILTDDPSKEIGPADMLAFDGTIEVAGSDLSVVTAYDDILLSMPTKMENVRLRVWVDHPECPSRIVIGAG